MTLERAVLTGAETNLFDYFLTIREESWHELGFISTELNFHAFFSVHFPLLISQEIR